MIIREKNFRFVLSSSVSSWRGVDTHCRSASPLSTLHSRVSANKCVFVFVAQYPCSKGKLFLEFHVNFCPLFFFARPARLFSRLLDCYMYVRDASCARYTLWNGFGTFCNSEETKVRPTSHFVWICFF